MKKARQRGPRTRIVARKGCPWTDRDVRQGFGPAFIQIAEAHKIDYPQLTAKHVYAAIEKDPAHPLWKYINTDRKRAMRSWVIQQIDNLLGCCRFERVDWPELKPSPLFESVADTSESGKEGTGRARVFAPAIFDNSVHEKQVADKKALMLRQSYESLRSWVLPATTLPAHYAALVKDMGAALAEFDAVESPRRRAKKVA